MRRKSGMMSRYALLLSLRLMRCFHCRNRRWTAVSACLVSLLQCGLMLKMMLFALSHAWMV